MKVTRKQALKTMAVSALGTFAIPSLRATAEELQPLPLKGNINHSVCQWCYNSIPLEDLVVAAKAIGISSVELLNSEQWPTALKHGLTCAMGYGSSIGLNRGFNDPSLHDQLLKDYTQSIPKAADAGIKSLICFSGNRNGLSDQQGLENCARGLEPVLKIAQKHNVKIVMELLNSKVDHKDYQCDRTPWGVELCQKTGSENFKLLYDIYHMQIMEGDVIATINKYKDFIGHYHTGGVPGRHEIDETQELYYPAIMKAIVKTGFKGFVAQEFIPAHEPLKSLKASITICDV
ncbi:hydroxypyruvate isomerase family protein [Pseudochryseolinea flava]|uniref:Hydroxypyruvate isomerase n=1 Tax=Pseudochryseolinea flava TaxID=2059302 RepID=A0A364Y8H9_9BACT|nr:TIM barrel protein [Pseudochryseolinea flava]RAW03250.1 hydroxypyruvate isomerase [Pseudochryseolinea flava]